MIKLILFTIIFIVFCFFSIIITYSDAISEKLTYNLNRNLNVVWGDDHPKFTKQNLVVDFLDMSIGWDYFNILFPNTQTALILNALSNIQSIGCISKVTFLIDFRIDITCSEIRIDLKRNKWSKYGELHISRTFFFERRVFDNYYDKQWNYNVSIDTKNLVVNNINLGHYLIEYSFIDKENLQLKINEEEFILTKKNEGLNIHTPESDFFILNRNYFNNTMKREITDV